MLLRAGGSNQASRRPCCDGVSVQVQRFWRSLRKHRAAIARAMKLYMRHQAEQRSAEEKIMSASCGDRCRPCDGRVLTPCVAFMMGAASSERNRRQLNAALTWMVWRLSSSATSAGTHETRAALCRTVHRCCDSRRSCSHVCRNKFFAWVQEVRAGSDIG